MIDEERYEADVNAQWIKLGNAITNEEVQNVLDTWPDKKDYEIKKESMEDNDDEDKQDH